MKTMKLNKLGWLSLLTLIGVLGLIMDRPLSGFFGFAYYFRYFFVTPDEMFLQNIRCAASIGFFTGIVILGIATTLHTLFPILITGSIVLASYIVASVVCFTFALLIFEIKEQRGVDE